MHNSRSHTPETEIIKSSLEDRYKSPDGKHDRQTMKIGPIQLRQKVLILLVMMVVEFQIENKMEEQ